MRKVIGVTLTKLLLRSVRGVLVLNRIPSLGSQKILVTSRGDVLVDSRSKLLVTS